MQYVENTRTTGRVFVKRKHGVVGVLVKQFAQVLCLGLTLETFYRRRSEVDRLLDPHGLQYVGVNPFQPPLWRLYGHHGQQMDFKLQPPAVQHNLKVVSSQSAVLDLENSAGLKDYPMSVPLYTKPLAGKRQLYTFRNLNDFLNNEFSDLDYLYDHGVWYVGLFKSDATVPNGYYIERLRLDRAVRSAFRRRLSRGTQA